mmetsp:Transcript_24000/g.68296  ORF Transcript_24000/g.68296 Transcript_24000/m.68296 type:complete len:220 (-) Transcript_24000:7-666(-)
MLAVLRRGVQQLPWHLGEHLLRGRGALRADEALALVRRQRLRQGVGEGQDLLRLETRALTQGPRLRASHAAHAIRVELPREGVLGGVEVLELGHDDLEVEIDGADGAARWRRRGPSRGRRRQEGALVRALDGHGLLHRGHLRGIEASRGVRGELRLAVLAHKAGEAAAAIRAHRWNVGGAAVSQRGCCLRCGLPQVEQACPPLRRRYKRSGLCVANGLS